MGKTFVEDERPCDSCVNVTRYGCVSWNCEYINRDEAIKAWREKHEMADRKTEPTTHDDYIETENDHLEAKCLNCNNAKACKEKHWEGCVYEPQTDCSWK